MYIRTDIRNREIRFQRLFFRNWSKSTRVGSPAKLRPKGPNWRGNINNNNNIIQIVLLREKSYFRKVRKCYAISEKREGRNVKMSKLCPLRENNSTSILCLPDEVALVNLIWSSFWTVEDQFVRSRYVNHLLAAQSAEVYTGAQSLHTSWDGFMLVVESDFGFG